MAVVFRGRVEVSGESSSECEVSMSDSDSDGFPEGRFQFEVVVGDMRATTDFLLADECDCFSYDLWLSELLLLIVSSWSDDEDESDLTR